MKLDARTLAAPIVGMRFHPPAEGVLQLLGAETPLLLVPEPENPYDEKAVKVLVEAKEMLRGSPSATVADVLAPYGFDYEELERQGRVMLGYLAREDTVAKMGRVAAGLASNADVLAAFGPSLADAGATLAFDMRGAPVARIMRREVPL